MRMSTPLRTAAAVMLCGLVIAACGQKAGVRVAGDGLPAGQPLAGEQADADGAGTATEGPVADPIAGTETGATVTDSTSTTGGGQATGGQQATTRQPATGQQSNGAGSSGGGRSTAAGGSGGDGGGEATSGGGTAQVQGSDRTGVGDNQIVIGVHAPATGAAPLPTTSFEKARGTYWRHIAEQGQTVLGRDSVKVIYRDDKYDPSSAGQVCREMAAEAFMLAGGGGTDQIQRCGQLANTAGFPYFSAGVTEAGLAGNPWYFAMSMSYRQQGGLLAQYVARNPDGIDRLGANARIGTIITDTPNFDDALQGWQQGLADNGLQNQALYRHPKGDTSWYAAAAEQFSKKGINVVYINTSPVDYIQFANTANERYGYNPQYVGVGITKGLNSVLQSGCNDDPELTIGSGIFLSPFPGLDAARDLTPEFFAASEEQGAPQDDIALALWGVAEGQHKLFQAYGETFGNDLTREDFRALVEAGTTIDTSTYPTVRYTPDNHFGASSAHVLKADCSIQEHTTLHTFASGF